MEGSRRSGRVGNVRGAYSEKLPQHSTLAFFFLLVYLVLVLFRPQEIFSPLSGIPVVMIATIFCTIAALLLQRPLRWAPQQTFLLLLLPVISISAALNGWATKGLTDSQVILVSSILPLFLFSSILSSVKKQQIVMLVCIVASLVMIHNGWTQYNSYNGYGWAGTQLVKDTVLRITYVGIFEDPNDLGMLIVMNLSFLAYFFHRGGFITKNICLFIFIIFMYGVFLTGSRGTVLGTAAVAGFYLLLRHGGTRLVMAAIILGPVIATLVSQFGGLSSGESSARLRLYAWYDGIHYLLSNPLFGIGKGNFTDHHGLTAHNSYILVASELGTLGYSLWGGALSLTMYFCYKVFKLPLEQFDSNPHRELIINEIKVNKALFFSMIGFCVTAFFLSRSYVLLLFIFMGMCIASCYRLIQLIPELKPLVSYKSAFFCAMSSWVMIFMVYITLKVSL